MKNCMLFQYKTASNTQSSYNAWHINFMGFFTWPVLFIAPVPEDTMSDYLSEFKTEV